MAALCPVPLEVDGVGVALSHMKGASARACACPACARQVRVGRHARLCIRADVTSVSAHSHPCAYTRAPHGYAQGGSG